jgi:hypothetical protein
MYTPYVYKPSHKPRNLEEEQAEQRELKLRAWAEGVAGRTRKAMKKLWLEEFRAAGQHVETGEAVAAADSQVGRSP